MNKLGLPGKCPNQDPACQPCQSRSAISKLRGRFGLHLQVKLPGLSGMDPWSPSLMQEPILQSCQDSLQACTEILAQDTCSTGSSSFCSRSFF